MKLNRIKLVLVEKEISQTQLAKELGKGTWQEFQYNQCVLQQSQTTLFRLAE